MFNYPLNNRNPLLVCYEFIFFQAHSKAKFHFIQILLFLLFNLLMSYIMINYIHFILFAVPIVYYFVKSLAQVSNFIVNQDFYF
jgi:hypothetical protein